MHSLVKHFSGVSFYAINISGASASRAPPPVRMFMHKVRLTAEGAVLTVFHLLATSYIHLNHLVHPDQGCKGEFGAIRRDPVVSRVASGRVALN